MPKGQANPSPDVRERSPRTAAHRGEDPICAGTDIKALVGTSPSIGLGFPCSTKLNRGCHERRTSRRTMQYTKYT